ncbi:hypothetical protein V6N13_106896 [Hibiscus sabdariffa]|uniref:Uncharacterized protein n=1 Tax=Hibiscus sabdariffa TaxID=183260 RepID=A0ABR2F242_9ROSI
MQKRNSKIKANCHYTTQKRHTEPKDKSVYLHACTHTVTPKELTCFMSASLPIIASQQLEEPQTRPLITKGSSDSSLVAAEAAEPTDLTIGQ